MFNPYDKGHFCYKVCTVINIIVRDWSLITGRGDYKMGRGGGGAGACEVLPLQKRGGGLNLNI